MRLIDADALLADKVLSKHNSFDMLHVGTIRVIINDQPTIESPWHIVNEDDPNTFPPDDNYILLSFANFDIPMGGRYEANEDGGGSFYVGDDERTCVQHGLFVNAWMPLPKCYNDD